MDKKLIEDLLTVITCYKEYVDALPENLILPAMPGFDRDWTDAIETKAIEYLEE